MLRKFLETGLDVDDTNIVSEAHLQFNMYDEEHV